MADYTLTWLEGRVTPIATRFGSACDAADGRRIVAARMATDAEAAQIERGEWVRAPVPTRRATHSDAAARSLYVMRPVTNAAEILSHYRGQGITETLKADDLHVTVIFSRMPVDWMKIGSAFEDEVEVPAGGPRLHALFGSANDALVLQFAHFSLNWRNERARELGASWDWPEYQPHITLSYRAGDTDLSELEPWVGEIKLGPEQFAEIDETWKSKVEHTADAFRSIA